LTTLYYLLFAHRSPIWLAPVALFLTLAVLLLTLWDGRRRPQAERKIEAAFWFCLVVPIVLVIMVSWLVRPIYLERSFAVSAPALMLLLSRGMVAAPKRSPAPYLGIALAITFVITLVMHAVTPDPVKPPLREAARMIEQNFEPQDVSLHLQDASTIPALWYTPEIPHLFEQNGTAWVLPQDRRHFGGDTADWQAAMVGADRLWLTVMPGYNDAKQEAVFQNIDSTYPRLMAQDWGEIQLYLYNLRGAE
jgi:hypothetical protein